MTLAPVPGEPPLLVANLTQLVTPRGTGALRGAALGELAVIEDAFLLVEDGRISAVGRMDELAAALPAHGNWRLLDGSGCIAIPGFVDAHTHLPFAGYRESELNRRLAGETYEQIAAGGGGIHSSVRATRTAPLSELGDLARRRADSMLLHGTTTAEAKSGYGLDLDNELKQLEALAALAASHPLGIVATLLAAHEVPLESRDDREAFLRLVCERIIPEVARRGLARFCDVFCETGVFSIEESRRVLTAARQAGMELRLHADELTPLGGAELAAEMGARSADHLMCVTERGIAALAASETVAVLLPGTSFFLRSRERAPARALIDAGCAVALATDFNPGSSHCESMPMMLVLACLTLGMRVEEALTAATLNGAASLGLAGEIGSLEPGKRADVVLCDVPNYFHLVYHYGVNPVCTVLKNGAVVVQDRRRVSSGGAHA